MKMALEVVSTGYGFKLSLSLSRARARARVNGRVDKVFHSKKKKLMRKWEKAVNRLLPAKKSSNLQAFHRKKNSPSVILPHRKVLFSSFLQLGTLQA